MHHNVRFEIKGLMNELFWRYIRLFYVQKSYSLSLKSELHVPICLYQGVGLGLGDGFTNYLQIMKRPLSFWKEMTDILAIWLGLQIGIFSKVTVYFVIIAIRLLEKYQFLHLKAINTLNSPDTGSIFQKGPFLKLPLGFW